MNFVDSLLQPPKHLHYKPQMSAATHHVPGVLTSWANDVPPPKLLPGQHGDLDLDLDGTHGSGSLKDSNYITHTVMYSHTLEKKLTFNQTTD